MTGPFCLIVNPAAAGGRAARSLPAVLGALTVPAGGVRICESRSLAHAVSVAGQASAAGEVVVAVGGDGLAGALAGAVARSGGVLGIIPAGRGNDFARMLGIPANPVRAAAALLTGAPRAVDVIGVRAGDSSETIVAASVYLGIPSVAGEIANRSRWARGALGYQAAGLRALLSWQPATFSVQAGPDEGGGIPRVFPGAVVLIANSAYLAAGLNAAPGADVTDGVLEVLTVRHGPRLSFVHLMLKARAGTHVGLSGVTLEQAASVMVRADRPMPAAADGETLACADPLAAGTVLRVRVLPRALRVITPA